MKKINLLKWTVAASMAAITFTACDKDNSLDSDSVIITEEREETALDLWLKETFLEPYNINVDYRWNQYKVDNKRYLTPAKPENVQKVMKVVKKVWIDSYVEVTYPEFIRENTNKEFVLVGGVNLNTDGTQTLGLADQGQRVVLFTVDLINVSSTSQIRQFIHTVQHEYVHILNQKRVFDKMAYGAISPSGYDSNWSIHTTASSLSEGFISSYARTNVDEDFAEMAAAMLVDIKAYNLTVEALPADAKNKIRQKESIVVEYYKSEWDIDFYKLCEETDKNTVLASQGL